MRGFKTIGKPGAGKPKLAGGLFIKAVFEGNAFTGKTFDFLSNTEFNKNSFLYIDEAFDFQIKVALEYANATTSWSTGGWDIEINVQFDNNLPSQLESNVQSPTCGQGDLVQNRFFRVESAVISGDSGLFGAGFSESTDPTSFTACQDGDNYIKGAFTMFVPGASKNDISVENPGEQYLQSSEIIEL